MDCIGSLPFVFDISFLFPAPRGEEPNIFVALDILVIDIHPHHGFLSFGLQSSFLHKDEVVECQLVHGVKCGH